ncbi:MAG: hypothetical protein ABWX63_04950, partial [Paeniglutamicibacter terrestris]
MGRDFDRKDHAASVRGDFCGGAVVGQSLGWLISWVKAHEFVRDALVGEMIWVSPFRGVRGAQRLG